MGLLPFKCGINGCKKSKLQKHVHTSGDLSRSELDRRLVADYVAFAQMRGEPISIPGGSKDDMNMFMKKRLSDGAKQAKKFRRGLKG
jgi:hypothetical protein